MLFVRNVSFALLIAYATSSICKSPLTYAHFLLTGNIYCPFLFVCVTLNAIIKRSVPNFLLLISFAFANVLNAFCIFVSLCVYSFISIASFLPKCKHYFEKHIFCRGLSKHLLTPGCSNHHCEYIQWIMATVQKKAREDEGTSYPGKQCGA